MSERGEELNGRAPDPAKTTRPTRTSMREEFDAAVERGDLAYVLERVLHPPHWMLQRGEGNAALARAVEVASRRSPTSFSRAIFRETISFCATVQLRLQLLATRALAQADETGQLPQELASSLLPQLRELMPLTAELLRTQAATARLWSLTQRTRARTARPVGRARNGEPAEGEDWFA